MLYHNVNSKEHGKSLMKKLLCIVNDWFDLLIDCLIDWLMIQDPRDEPEEAGHAALDLRR